MSLDQSPTQAAADREPARREPDVPAGSGLRGAGQRHGRTCTTRPRPTSVEFWARLARERLDWDEPFTTTLEWDLPFAKWFVGGKLNIAYNCVDRHVEERARRQGRLPLDRRAGRHADDHLRRPPPRGPEGGQRAQGARRRDRRSRRDLHADDPGAADRDARLRPDRGAAHGRLRGLLRRGAGGPDQRRPGQARHHRRRRLSTRQGDAAEAGGRRRRSPTARPSSTC